MTTLSDAVTRAITLLPQIAKRVELSGAVAVPKGTVMSARRGVRCVVEDADE